MLTKRLPEFDGLVVTRTCNFLSSYLVLTPGGSKGYGTSQKKPIGVFQEWGFLGELRYQKAIPLWFCLTNRDPEKLPLPCFAFDPTATH